MTVTATWSSLWVSRRRRSRCFVNVKQNDALVAKSSPPRPTAMAMAQELSHLLPSLRQVIQEPQASLQPQPAFTMDRAKVLPLFWKLCIYTGYRPLHRTWRFYFRMRFSRCCCGWPSLWGPWTSGETHTPCPSSSLSSSLSPTSPSVLWLTSCRPSSSFLKKYIERTI
ncbi:uncharacterized protein LOC104676270 isoform X2 [Rhinopithecus roxellana]|uniref:uncharacterized protein LOC104676270 isoform X2 n=1 Tax=Rhinopithecus roxellana TaxID=61622 RepID=UPI0012373110|nr:uncharacterized protein LOC104676270 isoform X2 [Rhinopithecus roxellana]